MCFPASRWIVLGMKFAALWLQWATLTGTTVVILTVSMSDPTTAWMRYY